MDYKSAATEELEQIVRQPNGQKNGAALCELGERYLHGTNSTKVNHMRAFQFFSKGEKLGEKRAYAALAEMYHNGILFPKNEDVAREYYIKAGIQPPIAETPPKLPEANPYVPVQRDDMERQIESCLNDAEAYRKNEQYADAKNLCGSLLQKIDDIRTGKVNYQGSKSVDELEAEVKWLLAYISYNEQRYDDMEQLLLQPHVLQRHPWGIYLMTIGHRVMQKGSSQIAQDLQMMIRNSKNSNMSLQERGDTNLMIAELLSEGFANMLGMNPQDARAYYQEAANCGNAYAKEQLINF